MPEETEAIDEEEEREREEKTKREQEKREIAEGNMRETRRSSDSSGVWWSGHRECAEYCRVQ